MSEPKLSVVEAFPMRCGDIAGQLRKFADELEAGEHGEVPYIVTVCAGDRMAVRGWGKIDGMQAIGALNLGLSYLVNHTLEELE